MPKEYIKVYIMQEIAPVKVLVTDDVRVCSTFVSAVLAFGVIADEVDPTNAEAGVSTNGLFEEPIVVNEDLEVEVPKRSIVTPAVCGYLFVIEYLDLPKPVVVVRFKPLLTKA